MGLDIHDLERFVFDSGDLLNAPALRVGTMQFPKPAGAIRRPGMNLPIPPVGEPRLTVPRAVDPVVTDEGRPVKDFAWQVQDLFQDWGINSRNGMAGQRAMTPLKELMASKGWTFEGAGHFSAAFSKGDRVVKVTGKVIDGGMTYAAWARAHQGMPGVPVIHEIHGGAYACLVEMEKLVSPDWNQQDNEHYQQIKEGLRVGFYDEYTGPDGEIRIRDTAATIGQFFRGLADEDMHRANVMTRPATGELIITDPVSFVSCSSTSCKVGM